MNAQTQNPECVRAKHIYVYIRLARCRAVWTCLATALNLRAAGAPEPVAAQHLAGQQRGPADAAKRQNEAPRAQKFKLAASPKNAKYVKITI